VEALLRQRFVGLADQRVFRAALIDRNVYLCDRRSAQRALGYQGLVVSLVHRALQTHGRQQRTLVDLDLEEIDVDAIHGGGDVGIFDQAELDGLRQGRWE